MDQKHLSASSVGIAQPAIVSEAEIIINGVPLSSAQAMTIRVALESFALDLVENGLGDDEDDKAMAELYKQNIKEIRAALYG